MQWTVTRGKRDQVAEVLGVEELDQAAGDVAEVLGVEELDQAAGQAAEGKGVAQCA